MSTIPGCIGSGLAVHVRVGDPPKRVERCVEVRGGLPRERDRSLDRLSMIAAMSIE